MHVDDRLSTVLRLRTQGIALARIQYRQLIDLLGTQAAETRSETVEAAYERLAELSRRLPYADRAAILRDKAIRLRAPRLVATLSSGERVLAEAAIDAAQLELAQWTDLLAALPPVARARLGSRADLAPALAERLMRLGVGRLALPTNEEIEASAATSGPPVTAARPEESALPDSASIGAIVKRIEAYRKSRQESDFGPVGDAPRLPLGEEHVLHVPAEARAFDFATDPAGRIVWADPGVAPMVLGQMLAGPDAPPTLAAALRARQPILGQQLPLSGGTGIAGLWRIDATARFDPLTGGFLGHQGRMRRWPLPGDALSSQMPAAPESEADRIRQLLHELRTPVNAIQGFAEVIQQQLFGTTPHEYRALAATIAGDAARMLAAFEELERLARLESAALDLEPGETDAAAVFAATIAQLAAHTGQRGSGFAFEATAGPCLVPLARIEMEQIAWRLLATLAGTAAPGEQLAASVALQEGFCRIAIALPASLAARSDKDLFEAAPGAVPQVIAAGVFGVGFALRLVRAEATAAGGGLVRENGQLIVTLPGLTEATGDHSQAI